MIENNLFNNFFISALSEGAFITALKIIKSNQINLINEDDKKQVISTFLNSLIENKDQDLKDQDLKDQDLKDQDHLTNEKENCILQIIDFLNQNNFNFISTDGNAKTDLYLKNHKSFLNINTKYPQLISIFAGSDTQNHLISEKIFKKITSLLTEKDILKLIEFNCLNIAAESNNIFSFDFFIQSKINGIDVNLLGKDNFYPVNLAQKEHFLRYILSLNPDLNLSIQELIESTTNKNSTVFDFLSQSQFKQNQDKKILLDIVMNHFDKFKNKNEQLLNFLANSFLAKNYDSAKKTLQTLLSLDVNLNDFSCNGKNLLSLAVDAKYLTETNILLQNNLDPFFADEYGNCAFFSLLYKKPPYQDMYYKEKSPWRGDQYEHKYGRSTNIAAEIFKKNINYINEVFSKPDKYTNILYFDFLNNLLFINKTFVDDKKTDCLLKAFDKIPDLNFLQSLETKSSKMFIFNIFNELLRLDSSWEREHSKPKVAKIVKILNQIIDNNLNNMTINQANEFIAILFNQETYNNLTYFSTAIDRSNENSVISSFLMNQGNLNNDTYNATCNEFTNGSNLFLKIILKAYQTFSLTQLPTNNVIENGSSLYSLFEAKILQNQIKNQPIKPKNTFKL